MKKKTILVGLFSFLGGLFILSNVNAFAKEELKCYFRSSDPPIGSCVVLGGIETCSRVATVGDLCNGYFHPVIID